MLQSFSPIIQMIFLATYSVFFSLALPRSLYFSFPGKGKTLVFFFWFQQQLTSLSLCQKLLVREKGESTSLGFQATRFEKKKEKPSFFFFYLSPFLFSHLTLLREHKKPSFFFFFFPKNWQPTKKEPPISCTQDGTRRTVKSAFAFVFQCFRPKKEEEKRSSLQTLASTTHISLYYTRIYFWSFPRCYLKKKKKRRTKREYQM